MNLKIKSSNANTLNNELDMAKEVERMCLDGGLITGEALGLIREKYEVK